MLMMFMITALTVMCLNGVSGDKSGDDDVDKGDDGIHVLNS